MKAVPVVCIYGSEEQPEVGGKVKNINFVEKIVPGGHHYDNTHDGLATIIVGNAGA